jgi:hypothetical protein
MFGISPLSAAPFAALPSTPAPHHLWFDGLWSTRGGRNEELPFDSAFDLEGVTVQKFRLDGVWTTRGLRDEELPFDARWYTSGFGGELPFDGRWATVTPLVRELPFDAHWITRAPIVVELPLDSLWDTRGAPHGILPLDGRWSTTGAERGILPLDGQWNTDAPLLSFVVLDGLWATAIPDVSELPFDGLWGFNVRVANDLSIVYGSQIARGLTIRYELGRTRVARGCRIPLPMLARVASQCAIVYDIRNVDELRSSLRIRYSILDGAVIEGTPVPEITVRGKTFKSQDCEVNVDEGDSFWTARMNLRDPALLALFGPDEPFTILFGGETYSFIRDEPGFTRSGQVSFSVNMRGVSPGAIYADPRATRITKTWDVPTLASAVLAEIMPDVVVTLEDVIDWTIPANRLVADNRTPIEIAKQIAGAAGAVLESEPDGSLTIRPLTAVPVPEWTSATPDASYDDLRDQFSVTEETPVRRLANAFRILDGSADDANGLLQIEVDTREDGLNDGRSDFVVGDRPGLLIFKSLDVDVSRVRASAGVVSDEAAGTTEKTEDLNFANAAEAKLAYPTAALDSFEWLGTDLGTPTLDGEQTIRLDEAGVGILRVTYTTSFLARRVSNVPSIGDEDDFDVLVVAEGER